jgi:predicted aldo/keto reductase-like oxidoreductase
MTLNGKSQMNVKQDTRREFIKKVGGTLASAGLVSTWDATWAKQQTPCNLNECPSSQEMTMAKRILGRTKLPVPLLGFGVGPIIDAAVYQRAFDLGIRYFHLSFDKYSTTLPPGVKFNTQALNAIHPFRKHVVVSYMTTVRSQKRELLADLDDFLKQSGFGHLDVWFVCCPSPELLEEFREANATARKAGKVRWGALSTHSLDATMPHLLAPDAGIDVVMLTYNYTASSDDQGRLAKLHHAGLGITPMKPLAGRFFKETSDDPAPLLRWLAADERVHTIPVGMKTIEQVEQNVAALRKPLSDEDRDVLTSQFAYTSPRFCRMCGVCDGRCPQTLAIRDLVRCAMYAEGYKDLRMARNHFTAIPVAKRRDVCKECRVCAITCPNGVAIRDRVQRAQELLS